MRGVVTGLTSPHPLADTLPSMLREDAFAGSLCETFDNLLAPALLTLDTFANYLDPATTPEDMIPWLAQWFGLGVDPNVEQWQRHELQVASSLIATRGTGAGIKTELENALGMPIEVSESGVAHRSPMPGEPLPGGAQKVLLNIVVHPFAGQEVDLDRIEALIRSVKPVHVSHTVSVQPA